MTLWECGTVLPSPRPGPPPSWLPWLRKEAPRGADILTGWMSERNYWSLRRGRPLVSPGPETRSGAIEAFVKMIQPIRFGSRRFSLSVKRKSLRTNHNPLHFLLHLLPWPSGQTLALESEIHLFPAQLITILMHLYVPCCLRLLRHNLT